MTDAFSIQGRNDLAAFLRSSCLIAFDYDGTLVPITKHPDKAIFSSEIKELVLRLRDRYPVSIVSGRSRADLEMKTQLPLEMLIGNHGIEGPWLENSQRIEYKIQVSAWHKQLTQYLARSGDLENAWIENKEVSLSIHYRDVSEPRQTQKLLIEQLSQLIPQARYVLGKSVINVLPQDGCHKGQAIHLLLRQFGWANAIFVGDDVTDEDVFLLRSPNILGVHIGMPHSSAAQLYLSRQSKIKAFMELLLAL